MTYKEKVTTVLLDLMEEKYYHRGLATDPDAQESYCQALILLGRVARDLGLNEAEMLDEANTKALASDC